MNKPQHSAAPAGAKHAIYHLLARIPRGKVLTYGRLAEYAGLGRAARAAASALKHLPEDSTLPWHRVVNHQGRIAFPASHPHHTRQKQLLLDEGVRFVGERIALSDHLWIP